MKIFKIDPLDSISIVNGRLLLQSSMNVFLDHTRLLVSFMLNFNDLSEYQNH